MPKRTHFGPTSEEVKPLIQKVIMKLVRIKIIDGREYIGLLGAVDKGGALFIQDALEVFHRKDKNLFVHDLYTPYIIRV